MSSLVSVIISTYNSSEFITETLDSIYRQTWKELELIITDDSSQDETLEVCRMWLGKHKDRFVSTNLITSDVNTGVSANANRGVRVSTGTWIKFLGADDTLLPSCISNNMLFVWENPSVKVLFSRVNIYQDTFEDRNFIRTTPESEISRTSIIWPERTAESQYKMLLLCDRIHFTPSLFINKKTFLEVGGFDERFRMLEDYPLWLNLTRNGIMLHFMNKISVNYRRHRKSINNTSIEYLVNPNYLNQEDFRRVYTYPHLPLDIRLNARYTWFLSSIFKYKWMNKQKQMNRFLLSLFTIYLNPFKYYLWLKQRLIKSLKYDEFYM